MIKMNNKKYFTHNEAIEWLTNSLSDYGGYYCDLHDHVFNEDYYLIYNSEARAALNQYDVFDAIEKIVEYEEDNFGELLTDIGNPFAMSNMLFYIIGIETLIDYDDRIRDFYYEVYDDLATDETNERFIKVLITVSNERND